MEETDSHGSYRLLLVDDHAVVRAGIATALRVLPNVEVVGEVGEAGEILPALERNQPDCLLIDVAMPNFDPLATIAAIRARYPALKILVVSAHDDDVYVQGLLRAGVNGYHLKDQPLGDLRLAVQQILAGGRWISAPLLERLVQPREAASAAPTLTNRQRDMLRCLQEGLDNQAIARQMGLSVKTVENHLTRLYRQIQVQSRLEAVHYANRHGITPASGKPPATRPGSAAPTPAAGRQTAVLLVDDSERYRTQLRRMVQNVAPGVVVFEAENLHEAVRLARERQPRLALVDVVLGSDDGIACTRQIRAASPDTRVVLMSAYPDREFHRSGLEAGAVAFLDKKDLDSAALRLVLEDVLD
ncbi:MAG: response regulator [Chloroflexaceae bacterium]|jgi:DNA-binding NarL/FixJ family response regulator|nr:response regulator [Chloroflexaceae bacterium]